MSDFVIAPLTKNLINISSLLPLDRSDHIRKFRICMIGTKDSVPPPRYHMKIEEDANKYYASKLPYIKQGDSLEFAYFDKLGEQCYIYYVIHSVTDNEVFLRQAMPPNNPITEAILRAWKFPFGKIFSIGEKSIPAPLLINKHDPHAHCPHCNKLITEKIDEPLEDPGYQLAKDAVGKLVKQWSMPSFSIAQTTLITEHKSHLSRLFDSYKEQEEKEINRLSAKPKQIPASELTLQATSSPL